ncbi:hypothetical protein ACH5RR_018095 [Cinchona calisaya]|uniref:Uncharacterized protein n=1 Tax=Cinchona calisaya TaxID=153742 RepID=A0ABD2ZKL0_9GENT
MARQPQNQILAISCSPLLVEFFKLNVDRASEGNAGLSGRRGIIRDHHGRFCFGFLTDSDSKALVDIIQDRAHVPRHLDAKIRCVKSLASNQQSPFTINSDNPIQ